MTHIEMAAHFNRIRDTLTTPEQHEALDTLCMNYAEALEDAEQQNEFQDHCLMGGD